MGKTFGNLYYIRNIVYYKVSSYEQKAFGSHFWIDSIINAFNEIKFNAKFILPPFTLAYLAIKWGEAERDRLVRKDPNLHKDDDE